MSTWTCFSDLYVFLIKKLKVMLLKKKLNEELAKEFHKPIIRKFEKRKLHSSFIDNNWGADLADMQLVSTVNKGFRFVLVLLTFIANMHELFFYRIKGITITLKKFKKIVVDESKCKPNKMWINKGSEFYNINEIIFEE